MLGATEIIIILAVIAFLFGGEKLKDKFIDWAKKAKQAKDEVTNEILSDNSTSGNGDSSSNPGTKNKPEHKKKEKSDIKDSNNVNNNNHSDGKKGQKSKPNSNRDSSFL